MVGGDRQKAHIGLPVRFVFVKKTGHFDKFL
jgi:hypothetical protein